MIDVCKSVSLTFRIALSSVREAREHRKVRNQCTPPIVRCAIAKSFDNLAEKSASYLQMPRVDTNNVLVKDSSGNLLDSSVFKKNNKGQVRTNPNFLLLYRLLDILSVRGAGEQM